MSAPATATAPPPSDRVDKCAWAVQTAYNAAQAAEAAIDEAQDASDAYMRASAAALKASDTLRAARAKLHACIRDLNVMAHAYAQRMTRP